jgi:Major Facilitator Superfamily
MSSSADITTGSSGRGHPDRYKWIALSNTTLAVLLATLDASITLIAMPDIFRGIHLDPLIPANSFYLLWMILGYLVVSSVLIVSLGRLGDIYGRVKIYNLGFVIYTVASLLLAVEWLTGRAGADYLIGFRIVQGVGGAGTLADGVRESRPRLRRDRRAALGHGRRRERLGAPLASGGRLPRRLRRAPPSRLLSGRRNIVARATAGTHHEFEQSYDTRGVAPCGCHL